MRFSPLSTLAVLSAVSTVRGGLLGLAAYGMFQIGCNRDGLAVACCGAAGATFGTVVAAPAAPAVILGCNAALATCMATCAALALAPIP